MCETPETSAGIGRTDRAVTVSVIVPVLNEVERLGPMLQSLRAMDVAPLEVLVCDGGSHDGTQVEAERLGALVLQTPPGRGRQIHAGAGQAKGDVLFFAHADMTLEPDTLQRVLSAINRTGKAGGAVGCRFDSGSPFMRVVNVLNVLRARWFGISFGDQGQFVRRGDLDRMGGFPDLLIMEDVEFAFRLKTLGRPLYLGAGVLASSRKWERKTKWTHAMLIISLVTLYSVHRFFARGQVDVSWYYKCYYGRLPGS